MGRSPSPMLAALASPSDLDLIPCHSLVLADERYGSPRPDEWVSPSAALDKTTVALVVVAGFGLNGKVAAQVRTGDAYVGKSFVRSVIVVVPDTVVDDVDGVNGCFQITFRCGLGPTSEACHVASPKDGLVQGNYGINTD